MTRITFKPTGKGVKVSKGTTPREERPLEEVIRELKADGADPRWSYYRERSLAIHGPVCARCGREFSGENLRLLTVHHIDGNHANNPPDGSNWENLCVYCHEDVHSRETLGDYHAGEGGKETATVYSSAEESSKGLASLGDLLNYKRKTSAPTRESKKES
ncbi:MAG TPA: YajD family HNH nuclease [Syntrophales bacterium]|nr:YajD family HNH nuclease [Syntrophales bacterium]HOL59943.1 YajD family HNH nuclease [Syntrophales bacterium]HPO36230.1 YajD family HNH nuclease [Syntrophales bacterium]